MARNVALVAFGVVIGIFGAAAAGIHADDEVDAAALEAGVDPVLLAGAVATTGVGPREYLAGVGELVSRGPTPSVPDALRARVKCIELKESGGANVPNRRGSGAAGVLQYMPFTFAAHAREMGHPEWSPWNPDQARAVAAHDLMMGRRAQWTVSGC